MSRYDKAMSVVAVYIRDVSPNTTRQLTTASSGNTLATLLLFDYLLHDYM